MDTSPRSGLRLSATEASFGTSAKPVSERVLKLYNTTPHALSFKAVIEPSIQEWLGDFEPAFEVTPSTSELLPKSFVLLSVHLCARARTFQHDEWPFARRKYRGDGGNLSTSITKTTNTNNVGHPLVEVLRVTSRTSDGRPKGDALCVLHNPVPPCVRVLPGKLHFKLHIRTGNSGSNNGRGRGGLLGNNLGRSEANSDRNLNVSDETDDGDDDVVDDDDDGGGGGGDDDVDGDDDAEGGINQGERRTIEVQNWTRRSVEYRVLSTNPGRYVVYNSQGLVAPLATTCITIRVQSNNKTASLSRESVGISGNNTNKRNVRNPDIPSSHLSGANIGDRITTGDSLERKGDGSDLSTAYGDEADRFIVEVLSTSDVGSERVVAGLQPVRGGELLSRDIIPVELSYVYSNALAKARAAGMASHLTKRNVQEGQLNEDEGKDGRTSDGGSLRYRTRGKGQNGKVPLSVRLFPLVFSVVGMLILTWWNTALCPIPFSSVSTTSSHPPFSLTTLLSSVDVSRVGYLWTAWALGLATAYLLNLFSDL